MKLPATIALGVGVCAAIAAFGGAQLPSVTLVKGTPTNYRAFGYDISWVDASTQRYYLADRTNNAVDVIDASTDTFLGYMGKGSFTGLKPCPARPKDMRHCAGPNGVVTDDLGHVWSGDGEGNVIEMDASKIDAPILKKIPTGGKFRVDELAYDSKDKMVMTSNDGDTPPFLSFISVTDGKILAQYKYPKDQDGMEQPAWNAETGWFYQNVPGAKNRIDAFDPHHLPNPVKSFPVECKGGALDLTLSGLTIGPKGRLMTVCGSVGGLGLDPRTGQPGKPIPQVGDTDEVWYDPATESYYFAHSVGGDDVATTMRGAVGIVSATTEQFVREIPLNGAGVHSVAVNPKNKHVFVPVYGKGIYVFSAGK